MPRLFLSVFFPLSFSLSPFRISDLICSCRCVRWERIVCMRICICALHKTVCTHYIEDCTIGQIQEKPRLISCRFVSVSITNITVSGPALKRNTKREWIGGSLAIRWWCWWFVREREWLRETPTIYTQVHTRIPCRIAPAYGLLLWSRHFFVSLLFFKAFSLAAYLFTGRSHQSVTSQCQFMYG